MIPYTIDTRVRQIAAGLILLGSFVLSYITSGPTNTWIQGNVSRLAEFGVVANQVFPYSVSFLTFWGLFWWVFDRWLWRVSFFRDILGIPDLRGRWTGTMERYDYRTAREERDIPVEMAIAQTASRISIKFWSKRDGAEAGGSASDVALVGMSVSSREAKTVSYIFQFFNGKGICEMTFVAEEPLVIRGKYSSTVPRVGTFQLKRAA